MSRLFALVAALFLSAITVSETALAAPADIAVATPFEAVALKGGGELIVRRGSAHRVQVLRGDPAALEVTSTRRNGLTIRCRPNACRSRTPQVLVIAPEISALAVDGGGRIIVERGFAPQSKVALAVHGGGQIDSSQLGANSVAAAVVGGGSILAFARSSLAASVLGGGLIRYLGDPTVTTAIQGGGAVRAASSGAR